VVPLAIQEPRHRELPKLPVSDDKVRRAREVHTTAMNGKLTATVLGGVGEEGTELGGWDGQPGAERQCPQPPV